ncbi:MAG: hypothetical protein ACTSYD_02490 [Candidatus Heimdallarchaeaceae archaeon]
MVCSIQFGKLAFKINNKGDVEVYYLNKYECWGKTEKLTKKDMKLLLKFYQAAIIGDNNNEKR